MTTLQTPLTVASTAAASGTLAAGKHTPVDATTGALTMTLPTPANVGARLRVEKIDAGANAVTISGTIRGSASTIVLTSQYETQELFAESLTSWRVAASHRTKAATDAAYNLPTQTGNSGKFLTTNGTAPSWGASGSGLPANILTKATTYTASSGDFVQADTTSAGFTVTLPTSPTTGALVVVKKVDGTANVVTVAPSAGGNIDGDATATTSTPWAAATFEHVGSNAWRIVTASIAGTQGPQGSAGATGPQGATGPTGPTGPSGLPSTVVNRTTTYTASVSDFVQCDTSSAGFTVTLPSAPAVGAPVTTIKISSDGNTLTVVPAGSGSINGDATATAVAQWAKATFEHVGSDVWRIV